MKRTFESIMNSLKNTIASYDYYVCFEKVFDNVSKIEESLIKLNTLIGIGEKDFDNAFIKIINADRTALTAVPILLAIRDKEFYLLDDKEILFDFNNFTNTDAEYLKFVVKSGLKSLLCEGLITNLKDYVIGIEAGLDSNARKNRSGFAMENRVENYLKIQTNNHYLRQASKAEIKEFFKCDEIDKLNLTEGKKQANKVFDFAFKHGDFIYLVETNFYGSNGSKLNEVARSYEKLADEINASNNFRFVWITDGKGWRATKNGLNESYIHQKYLFTLEDLENNNLDELLK